MTPEPTETPNPFIPKIGLADAMRTMAMSMKPESNARALLVTGAGQLDAQAGILLHQQQTINQLIMAEGADAKANLELLARARTLPDNGEGEGDAEPA